MCGLLELQGAEMAVYLHDDYPEAFPAFGFIARDRKFPETAIRHEHEACYATLRPDLYTFLDYYWLDHWAAPTLGTQKAYRGQQSKITTPAGV